MRRGVTLVELLVTITIIAIISAAVLGTAASAIESGREKKTISTIAKIDGLISEKLASYETRRIPLHPNYEVVINHSFQGGDQNRGKAMADCRLLALRELQKFEMPDRWTDIINDPVMLTSVPQLAAQYRRLYDPDMSTLNGGSTSGDEASFDNQGAECLYAVVMYATGDGEARSLFQTQDIGDTDGDGRKEFVDGWGQPITWLRWPTGYTRSAAMSGEADLDPDPFDLYGRDKEALSALDHEPAIGRYNNPPTPPLGGPNVLGVLGAALPKLRDANPAFRIRPLITSRGSDGEQGFTSKGNDYAADIDPYTATEPNQAPPEDAGLLPGTITNPEGASDNVTNHAVDY